jgi:hypothetical protein
MNWAIPVPLLILASLINLLHLLIVNLLAPHPIHDQCLTYFYFLCQIRAGPLMKIYLLCFRELAFYICSWLHFEMIVVPKQLIMGRFVRECLFIKLPCSEHE